MLRKSRANILHTFVARRNFFGIINYFMFRQIQQTESKSRNVTISKWNPIHMNAGTGKPSLSLATTKLQVKPWYCTYLKFQILKWTFSCFTSEDKVKKEKKNKSISCNCSQIQQPGYLNKSHQSFLNMWPGREQLFT